MRTTVRLDDHLLREAKQLAARRGETLTAVIEDALRQVLGRSQARSHQTRVKLPTFKGNGLMPGVDLDDTRALLERMDRDRDPA